MLSPENRLRRREDFASAVRRGRRAGRPLLVVHLRTSGATDPHEPGEIDPSTRAGFVVSKAVGGAVVRTRVKRRLRHLIRDRLSGLPEGSLVVVRALPGAGDAGYDDLARDLDAALLRLSGGEAR
ncbi:MULTISPECIES: ribonuclease P protein component [unclassified Streptomyces]|uniref:ribonuclease P protein component n=1 Tax=unclassified Streptomyces TaxID=2593676 RepID=UPI000DC7A97B|nr:MULTISPECIES: ribonuclease P protein component [unclassified Streptomyces]AWZ06409.1 ribonuclease P protein component [Streptomyces sp. ICC4]AWZ12497.1 ribonuclease P protein component [Streptomyces sp. ICC1]